MAIAAKKPCRHPGCPNLTDGSYCPTHSKQEQKRYDTQRGTAAQRGYGSAWTKVRARKLRDNPLCERCEAEGRVRPATRVHHADRDAHNNAAGNLISICRACHEAEHKGDRFGNDNRR